MVSKLVPQKHALWGLLHDASEAYLPDIPGPLKKEMPQFQRAEDELLSQIAIKFGLSKEMAKVVKKADREALVTEMRDVMKDYEEMMKRTKMKEHPTYDVIWTMDPMLSEMFFLQRFYELTKEK